MIEYFPKSSMKYNHIFHLSSLISGFETLLDATNYGMLSDAFLFLCLDFQAKYIIVPNKELARGAIMIPANTPEVIF